MKYMSRAARMERHHKRHKGETLINLVSMIDMLTILVFFLLVYSTEEVEVLPSAKDVQLPESTAEAHAETAVVVIVTETDILVDGQSVGRVADVMRSDSLMIPALRQALRKQADLLLEAPEDVPEEEVIASREVTIMADKELPYELLKKVMATATAADYGQLSFAVLQKGSDAELTALVN